MKYNNSSVCPFGLIKCGKHDNFRQGLVSEFYSTFTLWEEGTPISIIEEYIAKTLEETKYDDLRYTESELKQQQLIAVRDPHGIHAEKVWKENPKASLKESSNFVVGNCIVYKNIVGNNQPIPIWDWEYVEHNIFS